MRVLYQKYLPGDDIPVHNYISNKKLIKYYTRETMAAAVVMGELIKDTSLRPETALFYASDETDIPPTCRIVAEIALNRVDPSDIEMLVNQFPQFCSPLERFKMMRNTTICLLAIEHGITGDNSLLLSSASGLLYSALLSDCEGEVIVGAGKLYSDGTVESGFAIGNAAEFANHPLLNSSAEAIEIFRPQTEKEWLL